MAYPKSLQTLIQTLKKLPGIGQKSAERFAFRMLDWKEKDLLYFAQAVEGVKKNLNYCNSCGCLKEGEDCSLCDPERRDTSIMCIVSDAKDVFSIEDMCHFNGMYHVLHGLLSPMDNRSIGRVDLEKVESRIHDLGTKEVILALDSTLEGDATSLFLKKQLEPLGIVISRLALGMPMGSSLDFVDEGTLSRAFSGRHSF